MARLFTLGRFELVGETAAANTSGVGQLPLQPKRLALLTYLTVAEAGAFHRRDTLLALLWPELGPEEARRALRQALHHLRRHLEESSLVTRPDDQVGLREGDVWCDAVELERAIRDGRDADGLALYRGPFLEGVHLADVSIGFEEWVSRTRVRLAAAAAQAAWRVAEREALVGNLAAAIDAARRGHTTAPDDEAGLQRLLRLLALAGDRAGALAAYDSFARRLAEDYGVDPSPTTRAIVGDIRNLAVVGPPAVPNGLTIGTSLAADSAAPSSPSAGSAPPSVAASKRFWSRRVGGVTGIVALTLVTGVAGIVRFASGTGSAPPVLAVGWLDNQAGNSAEATVTALRGLLATDLARVDGLSVISESRILEILAQLGRTEDAPGALGTVARRAGATELLEGTLYRRGASLRLELRRVDLERGVVRAVYAAEDPDPYTLVDRLTAQLAEEFGNRAPAEPLATSGTGSLVARALYEQGLRSYYRGEWQHAYDHLRASLAEDSSFAMAAYYASRAAGAIPLPLDTVHQLLELASRLSANAPTRDRLTIRLGRIQGHHAAMAVAESMVTRFPNEPSGLLALTHQRNNAGDWPGTISLARRVVVMDSLSLRGRTELCRACEAYEILIGAYHHVDSLATAERIARDYVRWRPASPMAWGHLFGSLILLRREKETFEALRRFAELMPGDANLFARIEAILRFDDHREAERLLRERLQLAPRDVDALWWLAIVLRHQGRMTEAGAVVAQATSIHPTAAPVAWLRAQVHFEKGEFLRAGALFDSSAHAVPDDRHRFPGMTERHQTWTHTHAATAWLAAGDTARVARLADSIEVVAPLSSYGRDWRLPNHVRGLLSMARGNPGRAVEEFRKAVYSLALGYSRTNLELARALLQMRRSAEAVPVLQAALRGPNDGSGTYATRPEFHELLGHAFALEGRRDSAAAHYRLVIDYWSGGDSPFRVRADSARARLRAVMP